MSERRVVYVGRLDGRRPVGVLALNRPADPFTSSPVVRALLRSLEKSGIRPPVLDHRVCHGSRSRLAVAWPGQYLGLQIEPLTAEELDAGNVATLMGWCVLRATRSMVVNGRAAQLIRSALGGS
ncbi:MAG: hypothetical protein IT201_14660 [Thermoleophilia bacterium]|nr:hypothetical protein [Thermoleophilia bacterium]